MKYRYPTILGLAVTSTAALAQAPALPAVPAPDLAAPALPSAPGLPAPAVPDASALTGQLEAGQAMLMSALQGGDAPELPGLADAPEADTLTAALADGEATLMNMLPSGGSAPDGGALMEAIAEGEAMLMDGLPEMGTLDVESSNGIDTEAGGFSNSYAAEFPEQGGGVVEGSLMDESFVFAYGGTLEELGYSYSVAGEEGAGSVNLADPQANELPEAPELPMP